ncbi:hypothetical protein GPJ56_009194 [Histomonas meleagridis]|uniref:uncharacterized protein n=1 Tax=Histomonas meleagridis TaxID=135588 RepID=UPI00355962C1|nr:hypothetical protein GPJ56_009194 [Histomonas meleagridis]KAH0801566.1 hypothetical protein GO595_005565 [Histomonas meleagridis]
MHIGKKPFENYRDMKVSVDLITEFINQQTPRPPRSPIRRRNTTRAPVNSTRRNCDPIPRPSSPNNEQERHFKSISESFASASAGQFLWEKIESDPEFIHRCLKRFGIQNDTHKK